MFDGPGQGEGEYDFAIRGDYEVAVRAVIDYVDTRRDLPVEIARTRFNRELAWHPDSHTFFYARLPEVAAAERRNANIRVYRHVIGRDSAKDEIATIQAKLDKQ